MGHELSLAYNTIALIVVCSVARGSALIDCYIVTYLQYYYLGLNDYQTNDDRKNIKKLKGLVDRNINRVQYSSSSVVL